MPIVETCDATGDLLDPKTGLELRITVAVLDRQDRDADSVSVLRLAADLPAARKLLSGKDPTLLELIDRFTPEGKKRRR